MWERGKRKKCFAKWFDDRRGGGGGGDIGLISQFDHILCISLSNYMHIYSPPSLPALPPHRAWVSASDGGLRVVVFFKTHKASGITFVICARNKRLKVWKGRTAGSSKGGRGKEPPRGRGGEGKKIREREIERERERERERWGLRY